MREELQAGAWGTVAWVWGVVLVIVAVATFYFVQPYFFEKERQNVENSRQYVVSVQTSLTTLRADYDALEVQRAELASNPENKALVSAIEGQEAGIVRQIREQAAKIQGKVPAGVAAFLATH